MTIHGVDNRPSCDWTPILRAARELLDVAHSDGDATALGGALGRLLIAVPGPVLVRTLQNRGDES